MFKRLYNLSKVTAVQEQRLARTLALVPSPLAKLEYEKNCPISMLGTFKNKFIFLNLFCSIIVEPVLKGMRVGGRVGGEDHVTLMVSLQVRIFGHF